MDITKLRPRNAGVILLMIVGVFLPGIAFIFMFNKPLFLTLEVFKLTVVGCTLSSPFFLLNTLMAAMSLETPKDIEEVNKTTLTAATAGSLFTCFVFYATLLYGFFNRLELEKGVILLLSLEGLVFVFALWGILFGKPTKVMK